MAAELCKSDMITQPWSNARRPPQPFLSNLDLVVSSFFFWHPRNVTIYSYFFVTMSPPTYRSQSLPPSTLNLHQANSHRIRKEHRPNHHILSRQPYSSICSSKAPSNSSSLTAETPSALPSHAMPETPLLPVSDPVSASPASSIPEMIDYLAYISNILTEYMQDPLRLSTAPSNLQLGLKAMEQLMQEAIRAGLVRLPTVEPKLFSRRRHRPEGTSKRQEQRQRKAIIEEAGKRYSTDPEHPFSVDNVLHLYAMRQIPLDGHWAYSENMDVEKRCKRCEKSRVDCVVVQPDRFWNRNRCALCLVRKFECSLDMKGMKLRNGEE